MNNKVSLIIIAMDEEFKYLLQFLNGNYIEEKFNDEILYSFIRNNKKYVAIRGRVGKVSTSFYLGQLSSKYNIERVIVAGGVSAKGYLRTEMKSMCDELNVDLSIPPMKYCTDNGTMIAAAGYYAYQDGRKADLTLNSKSQDKLQ